MEKKAFCQHCNEDVLTYSVIREGKEETCCLYCGLPLKKAVIPPVQKEKAKDLPVENPVVKQTGTCSILYADDSLFMRELLGDIIKNNNITHNYCPFEDGEKLIYCYTKALAGNERVDVIILDIKMPFISGIGTGVAIRAVERALDKKPAPILYFSVKQADDELKKLITHTAPSYYLNKGASTNVQDLEKRLVLAMKTILQS